MNQIGGCITEIATANTKILIDLGHNLPNNEGTNDDCWANEESVKKLTDGIDAIFYTHYHGDHVDLFRFVPKGVKQYIGETAKKVVIRKYQQLSRLADKKEQYTHYLSKVKKMLPLKEEKTKKIKGIQITPYFVSHSAYESFMFLIEAEGKRILHTGDFRDHGHLGKGLMKILKCMLRKGTIDVLIIEGTMLSRLSERVKKECMLQKDVYKIMSKYKNVFVLCSSTDMERLATFHAANKQIDNRPFVCDNYQADILQIFSDSAGQHSPLFVFDKVFDLEWKNKNCLKGKNEKLLNYMKNQGFCMLVRPTEKFVDYYYLLKKHINEEDTVLIYSMWEQYIHPESKHKKENYLNFVNLFPKIEKLHTSGHASADCLVEVCNFVNPTSAIIPIHSESSDDFKKLPLHEELKEKIVTESAKKEDIEIIIRIK